MSVLTLVGSPTARSWIAGPARARARAARGGAAPSSSRSGTACTDAAGADTAGPDTAGPDTAGPDAACPGAACPDVADNDGAGATPARVVIVAVWVGSARRNEQHQTEPDDRPANLG